MLQEVIQHCDKYGMLPNSGVVIVALSGGADSMALLSVAAELAAMRGFSVCAAHYNHKLRGAEAERDAEFVRIQCAARGIPFLYGEGNVREYAAERRIGIEEAAREARYRFFEDEARRSGAAAVFTAHNANDNAETVLMNIGRGAGLSGYCGIPPVRGIYARPLLCITRDEIEAYLRENGIAHIEDSTNADDIYTRNNIRHNVLPAMGEIYPALYSNIFAGSELLRDDLCFIRGLAEAFIAENASDGAVPAGLLRSLPRPVAVRVITALCGTPLTRRNIDDVLHLCRSSEGSASIALPGQTVTRQYDRLIFGCGDAHAGIITRVLNPGESIITEAGIKITCTRHASGDRINKSLMTFAIGCDSICGNVVIRGRLPGDSIKLPGRYRKTLKKLFIEERIPQSKRQLIPVIADDTGVLAVYGIGTDQRACAAPDAKALEIRCEEMPLHEK